MSNKVGGQIFKVPLREADQVEDYQVVISRVIRTGLRLMECQKIMQCSHQRLYTNNLDAGFT